MKTKIIVFLTFLVLWIWFYGVIKYHAPKSEESKISKNEALPNNGSDSIVQSWSEDARENWSIIDKAAESLELEKCDWISNPRSKNHCIDTVYDMKAKYEWKAELCEEIKSSSLRTDCGNYFAIKTASESWKKEDCEKISWNATAKYECLRSAILSEVSTSWFSWSTSVCDSLTWGDNTLCKNEIVRWSDLRTLDQAVSKNEIALCDTISDTKWKTNCRDSVNLNKWMWSTELSSCDSITNTNNKAACIENVKENRDSAAFSAASTSQNISSCQTISNAEAKNECINWISLRTALSTKSVSECEKITDNTAKTKCINTVNALNSVKK